MNLHRFCIIRTKKSGIMKIAVVIYIFAVAVSAYGTSCNRSGPPNANSADASYIHHSATESKAVPPVGYEGTYTGSPPCFTGKITTEITLDDNRYLLKNDYIIKNEHKGFEVYGEYTCSKDGGQIKLKGDASPTLYLIGNDVLIPLDEGGNPFDASGELFCLERVAVR